MNFDYPAIIYAQNFALRRSESIILLQTNELVCDPIKSLIMPCILIRQAYLGARLIRIDHTMTSSNGSIFRVTGPLCGESPVTDEFLSQRPVTRGFGVSLICTWTIGWVNSRFAGDVRRHGTHHDVTAIHITTAVDQHGGYRCPGDRRQVIGHHHADPINTTGRHHQGVIIIIRDSCITGEVNFIKSTSSLLLWQASVFYQRKRSFHFKAALSLAKRLATDTHNPWCNKASW